MLTGRTHAKRTREVPSHIWRRDIPGVRERQTRNRRRHHRASRTNAFVEKLTSGNYDGSRKSLDQSRTRLGVSFRRSVAGVLLTGRDVDACVDSRLARMCGVPRFACMCTYRGSLVIGRGEVFVHRRSAFTSTFDEARQDAVHVHQCDLVHFSKGLRGFFQFELCKWWLREWFRDSNFGW